VMMIRNSPISCGRLKVSKHVAAHYHTIVPNI
jgi:hypothetical protein